jgi:pyruvate ferredoxin oxidoreductase alpha subunit
VLTHATDRVELPAQELVDAFLPPFRPRQVLDPAEPITIGAMVGPEAFMEVRYLMHAKQRQALEAIPRLAADFEAAFGRASGGLVRGYRLEDAETVVVALGSVLGTLEDVVDERRAQGERVGALAVRTFRPYPLEAVRAALADAARVIVLEKAFAVGVGGIVGQNVRLALAAMDIEVRNVIAGLGGRPITSASLRRMLAADLPALSFLDLDQGLVERELARTTGPHAENMLRDLAGRA